MPRGEILERIQNCLVSLDIDCVQSVCKEALGAGISPIEAVEKGLSKGMQLVGQKFENGEFFLSELIMASEVMKEGMKILEPHIEAGAANRIGKMIVGTVEGDLHDIGKNLFASLARAAGFEVADLGVDVKTDDFAKSVRKQKPDILGMSALLTVTLSSIEGVVAALEKSKLRKSIRVIIGGAAVTSQYGKKARVDAAADSAVEGVNRCLQWLRKPV